MPLIGQLPYSRSKGMNPVPLIGESPCSQSRSKEMNSTPLIGESPHTHSRLKRSSMGFDDKLVNTICDVSFLFLFLV